ncbi:hypothetical protein [Streptomyces thioluteus]|uniref:hypothetical protein n=1 Tax=Streptomyces thioluteus TaxID=66431 RepID=UPI0031E70175
MASRALVIGPAEYAAESGVRTYTEIGVSAVQYGEVLAGNPMWGADHCRVLAPEEVRTAEGVMAALEEEARRTGPGDIFMVVYIGHGAYWGDVPGAEVHFSVGSSYKDKPWTWLSSWYLYRAMRLCKADLKVLIADCCYSKHAAPPGQRVRHPPRSPRRRRPGHLRADRAEGQQRQGLAARLRGTARRTGALHPLQRARAEHPQERHHRPPVPAHPRPAP